ncbi:MAG: hypothetical protein ACYSWZ_11635 [Planctomycetota bacterium]
MKNALMLTILVLVAGLAGIASGWNNRDIGSPSAPGSASYNGGTGKWTVTADGNDIWGHSDNFHYVYKSLMGEGGRDDPRGPRRRIQTCIDGNDTDGRSGRSLPVA